MIFDYLPQLARIDGIKYCCSAFFLVTALVPSNWGSVSTLLLKGSYFLHLQQRIKQHVPKTILQEHISQDPSTLARSCKPIRSFKTETFFSAIGQHLLQNPTCAHEYNDNKFSILARDRTSFHLSTLEATYIKTSKPNL